MVATLVLGGIRSGKSRFAESLLSADAPARYVATGGAGTDDPDWARRVYEHRLRRPVHWVTAETLDVTAELRGNPATDTLVDDLGTWLTGRLDHTGAWETGIADLTAETDELLDAIAAFAAHLVLVSPEVGLSVVPATAAGRLFADELGSLNQAVARRCDRVVLVVAGQPMTVKGGHP